MPEHLLKIHSSPRAEDLPGRANRLHLDPELQRVVREILESVQAHGDTALRSLTKRFDGVELEHIRVPTSDIAAAYDVVEGDYVDAVRRSIDAVRSFHESQIPREVRVETAPGVAVWRSWRPIAAVGLYVPGGRARYPSSVVMLAVTAQVSGCPKRILATPPDDRGKVPAATLVAAAEAGIQDIFCVGGAQAIGALAHGTQTVPKVDKIFGPGNAYVTAAKLQVFPEVAIDLPAGPSELLIIADETANAAWVAADMLANAEHGMDSPVLLVTTNRELAEEVEQEIQRQLLDLPHRDLITASLRGCSGAALVEDLSQAVALANEYAPEHLEIMIRNPHAIVTDLSSAGSVFLGPYSPNAAGDYCTGSNHVLPTGGFARMFAPLSVEAFGRPMQLQELSASGLAAIGPTARALARVEGLEAHARAIEIRQSPLPP